MTRERGTVVRTFDASPEHAGTSTFGPSYTYAYAMGPDGTEYVVCSEGVGWVVDDSHPLVVDTFSGGYSLPLDTVRDRAIAGTDVDLADHVRTFGSRLESNFWSWHYRINGR